MAAEAATPHAVAVDPPALGLGRSLRELWSRRGTIFHLAASDLAGSSRDKALGKLWSLLDPLLLLGIYFLVFGLGFRMVERNGPASFVTYLFLGILVVRQIDASASQAATIMRRNRGIIHELAFPKAVLPVAACLARGHDFLWGLAVLVAILILTGQVPGVSALYVLPLLAAQLLLALGLSFLVAVLGVFYADTTNVVRVTMRLALYLSPVFYYVRGEGSLIRDDALLWIYMLNPLACLIESYRDALLWHRSPELPWLAWALLAGGLCFVVGLSSFVRLEGRLAKHV